LLIEIPVGILFFLFNFDGFMRFVARNYVVNINQSLAEWIIGFSYLPRQFYAMLHQTESELFLSIPSRFVRYWYLFCFNSSFVI